MKLWAKINKTIHCIHLRICSILKEELEENERKNELLELVWKKKIEEMRDEGDKLEWADQELEAKFKDTEAKEKELQVFVE